MSDHATRVIPTHPASHLIAAAMILAAAQAASAREFTFAIESHEDWSNALSSGVFRPAADDELPLVGEGYAFTPAVLSQVQDGLMMTVTQPSLNTYTGVVLDLMMVPDDDSGERTSPGAKDLNGSRVSITVDPGANQPFMVCFTSGRNTSRIFSFPADPSGTRRKIDIDPSQSSAGAEGAGSVYTDDGFRLSKITSVGWTTIGTTEPIIYDSWRITPTPGGASLLALSSLAALRRRRS